MGLTPQEQDILRERIFVELTKRSEEAGGFLTFDELMHFNVGGQRIPLVGQKGINNPQIFDSTLSVVSAADGPYNDHLGPDGLIRYAFEAGDPKAGSNRKLLLAMETKTPIVYFERPMPNVYVPLVGAYIVDANFRELNVTVAIDSTMRAQFEIGIGEIEKRYITSEVKRRVHQPLFRAQVIKAYERRCAICRLNHAVLLDAAHIIPDADIGGIASIPNGLALCKIHHAAYDKNFLGIDADYRVHIDEDLLIEVDGPMLQHGLKEMHHTRISVPSSVTQRPDKDKLAERFELFTAS